MSLSPRAIALQGIGSSARLVAVQGLWPAAAAFTGAGIGRRIPIPRDLRDDYMRRLLDEDELLLLMAAQIVGSGLLH